MVICHFVPFIPLIFVVRGQNVVNLTTQLDHTVSIALYILHYRSCCRTYGFSIWSNAAYWNHVLPRVFHGHRRTARLAVVGDEQKVGIVHQITIGVILYIALFIMPHRPNNRRPLCEPSRCRQRGWLHFRKIFGPHCRFYPRHPVHCDNPSHPASCYSTDSIRRRCCLNR